MFDDTKIYFASDPEVLALACYSTMAHWRSEGRGPSFVKIGSKVGYRGSDLNLWIESRTVTPTHRGE